MLGNGDSNTVERLGVFARFPEPGRAKTRLIPALGPATDGGYYLIGLRAPASVLFEEIPWGTNAVFAETLRRASGLGLRVHQLRMLDDVDEPRDLTVWEKYRSLEGGPPVAMRPSVSVVIPALNEAARIVATIDSARRDDVEISVADGGSSDPGLSTISTLKLSRGDRS